MSVLSTIETDFSNGLRALASVFASSPAVQATGSTVSADLNAAAAAVETNLPTLAIAGLNAALALLGPEAAAISSVADAFLDALIAAATAKKTATSA